jgi:hypothetical protein
MDHGASHNKDQCEELLADGHAIGFLLGRRQVKLIHIWGKSKQARHG